MRMFVKVLCLFCASSAGLLAATPATPPLGASYTPAATTFSIWSPDTDDVKLLLGSDAVAKTLSHRPDSDDYSDVYSLTVPGDLKLTKYRFLIRGQAVRDPYGVMVDPASGMNIVINPGQTQPVGGWAPAPALVNREDAIIYELNVHDFTIDPSSGVTAAKRGKFSDWWSITIPCKAWPPASIT